MIFPIISQWANKQWLNFHSRVISTNLGFLITSNNDHKNKREYFVFILFGACGHLSSTSSSDYSILTMNKDNDISLALRRRSYRSVLVSNLSPAIGSEGLLPAVSVQFRYLDISILLPGKGRVWDWFYCSRPGISMGTREDSRAPTYPPHCSFYLPTTRLA